MHHASFSPVKRRKLVILGRVVGTLWAQICNCCRHVFRVAKCSKEKIVMITPHYKEAMVMGRKEKTWVNETKGMQRIYLEAG